jgi:hypothetical protein
MLLCAAQRSSAAYSDYAFNSTVAEAFYGLRYFSTAPQTRAWSVDMCSQSGGFYQMPDMPVGQRDVGSGITLSSNPSVMSACCAGGRAKRACNYTIARSQNSGQHSFRVEFVAFPATGVFAEAGQASAGPASLIATDGGGNFAFDSTSGHGPFFIDTDTLTFRYSGRCEQVVTLRVCEAPPVTYSPTVTSSVSASSSASASGSASASRSASVTRSAAASDSTLSSDSATSTATESMPILPTPSERASKTASARASATATGTRSPAASRSVTATSTASGSSRATLPQADSETASWTARATPQYDSSSASWTARATATPAPAD